MRTLINLLSALEFAAMLSDEPREAWSPPAQTVIPVIRVAWDLGKQFHEHVEALLWLLVEQRLVAAWLGDDATQIAGAVSSPGLRDKLYAAGTGERLIAYVRKGHEFPMPS